MGLRLSGEGCELQNLLTALESAHTRTYPGHILNYADDVSKPQQPRMRDFFPFFQDDHAVPLPPVRRNFGG